MPMLMSERARSRASNYDDLAVVTVTAERRRAKRRERAAWRAELELDTEPDGYDDLPADCEV